MTFDDLYAKHQQLAMQAADTPVGTGPHEALTKALRDDLMATGAFTAENIEKATAIAVKELRSMASMDLAGMYNSTGFVDNPDIMEGYDQPAPSVTVEYKKPPKGVKYNPDQK